MFCFVFKTEVDLGVCDDPGTPKNGFRYNETDSLRYGNKLYFSCSNGYILEGPDVIQCVKTYGAGENVSIADSHAVTWNNDPPNCTSKYTSQTYDHQIVIFSLTGHVFVRM